MDVWSISKVHAPGGGRLWDLQSADTVIISAFGSCTLPEPKGGAALSCESWVGLFSDRPLYGPQWSR